MAIFNKTKKFISPRRALAALAFLIACGPPPRDVPPVVDLRVCVENEESVALYRPHFKTAVAAEPRDGRECDAAVRGATLNAGKVTVRSAYDGSVLAEILGPMDLAPQLVKAALMPGTQAYQRVTAQRAAAGFSR
ncbi:MAG: hypothetical protein PHS14_05900 [Elusimicrobia bacterium]|nr:hypothetical protein [Elusimicrobiota bacterium]